MSRRDIADLENAADLFPEINPASKRKAAAGTLSRVIKSIPAYQSRR